MGAFDNTLILFLSDNGASAEKILRGDGNDPKAPPGSAKTFVCLEPGWANLANSAVAALKIFVHEGGISTPLIVHWPQGIKAHGELRHNPGHLIDLAPTILELAGGKLAADRRRRSRPAASGQEPRARLHEGWDRGARLSLVVSQRQSRHPHRRLEAGGRGNKEPWELYDLGKDRSETNDLAAKLPDKVRELEKPWQQHADEFIKLASK